AGSTAITLYLEKAGKQLLRIVDNGCGMSPDDAHLCFAPHATSKITSLNDLESISTFGFRGEALASIAAVSNVTLITRTDHTNLGIRIDYTAGTLIKEEPCACPEGTDLTVADLFYNTPVRKKFLKQDATELNQITSLVNAFCLSNPQISFKIFHDTKLLLNAPAVAQAKDRGGQLWDFGFADNLLSINPIQQHPDYPFTLTGYISQPGYYRYGRDLLFFFVNNRWVKNNELAKALLKGYLNVLPQGRFPAAFIFITIDVALVDVNVHPKKEEVRFARPGIVEQIITAAVQGTLEQFTTQKISASGDNVFMQYHEHSQNYINQRPSFVIPDSDQGSRQSAPTIEIGHLQQPHFAPSSVFPNQIFDQVLSPCHPGLPPSPELWRAGRSGIQDFPSSFDQQTSFSEPTTTDNLEGTIIGQLFSTYILIQHNDEFIMVDQHAAHERILYEEFAKNFDYKEGTALMFPEIVKLQEHQVARVLKEQDFFARQGIIIEQFGQTELVIKTSPPRISNQSLKELIVHAATFIEEHEELEHVEFSRRLNEHMHSHMACKTAVKAGDVLSQKEMQKLITDLAKTEKRFICVHGRPTIWTLGRSVIEKHFKRT
ncbi:MAG: DNA mismatch repair endonuclease MutL, partial [Candidatus Babeliales bacterium]